MIKQHILYFNTNGRATIGITEKVAEVVTVSKIITGLCQLFIHHTSASLIICENADPTVRQDLENFTSRWIQDGDKIFQHNAEGIDDMSAHLRTIFTQSGLSIPITDGQLALGNWQGVFLWEHRFGHFKRKITVTLIG